MRPNRIIIGEVREAEALDLLIALNSGLPGMGTIHANSARDAVLKLQTLPLLAGSNISHSFTVQTVASAIDLVVQISLGLDGSRRVTEILALTGRTENLHIEMEELWRWNGESYE
jgi:pilus assembly protein CpaF